MTGTDTGQESMAATSVPPEMTDLLAGFRQGNRVALARTISIVENERSGFQRLLHTILEGGLSARRVGMTGPPGAGKSTLLAALAKTFRDGGEEVGIVAVDPTSPYSGGALLGDRIRMNDLSTDPGIFIRSMATRGSLGGLATTTKEVIDLMDAFGFPRVMVETVGVGQTELEITGAADTVVVILMPESGDAIQAMKAGLMEIADIFVVNKADRPGADRLVKDLEAAIHLRGGEALHDVPAHHGVDLSKMVPRESGGDEADGGEEAPSWKIPVLKTVAHAGEGIDELVEALASHRRHLDESGELQERRLARAAVRVRDVVNRELGSRVWKAHGTRPLMEQGLDGIVTGAETPYSLARAILEDFLGG
jgi:LAO/AO transport system kinase